MLDIYPIRYPTKFLQKGEIAEEDTKFGFTNCFRIRRHIESLIIQYHLSGWKIGDIISNADEKTLEECKEKDGDLVAPTGGWVDLGLGFWVTAGLMSAMDSAKVYKIPYEWNLVTETFSAAGFTNKYAIVHEVINIWGTELWRNRIVTLILVDNKEGLKKLQEEDGGETRPFKPDQYEKGKANGWITDGLRHACRKHVKKEIERLDALSALLKSR